MRIFLSALQIHNYRSIRFLNLKLKHDINLFIGANNSGKSNILNAINIALSQRNTCSEDDFYHSKDHQYSIDDEIYIDLQFKPLDEDNNVIDAFDSFWTTVFMQFVRIDESGQQNAIIRTVLRYDKQKDTYVCERKAINLWNDNGNISQVKTEVVNSEMFDYIQSYYQGALRNFSSEMKDKKSFFVKTAESIKISDDKMNEIEKDLSNINTKIVASSPGIEFIQNSMKDIKRTLGNKSDAKIEPVPRLFKDLHRGMSVVVTDNGDSYFDVDKCGTGINSWVSFLSLSSFASQRKSQLITARPYSSSFFVSCLEEPEAFLHPQAQKQLLEMIKEFEGQLFISTHSQNIVSQIDLDNIFYVSKKDSETIVTSLFEDGMYTEGEKRTIKRVVLKTKGELLYGNRVILCEGVSDQEMIEVFFEKYFGRNVDYFGINVVPVAGQQYSPFIRLFLKLGIDFYILSDGEDDSINNLKKLAKDVMHIDYEECVNKYFYIHSSGDDLERSLIRGGYSEEINLAISIVTEDKDYVKNALKKNKVNRTRIKKTNKKCDKCGCFITEEITIPFIDGFTEAEDNLYHVMTRNKGKVLFASEIARQITLSNKHDNVPPLFALMFEEIKKKIG